MLTDFTYLSDLKPGRVFLVEDKNLNQFVLKENALLVLRLAKFSEMVHNRKNELTDLVPVFYHEQNYYWQKYLAWNKAGDTVKNFGFTQESFKNINPEQLARGIIQLQKIRLPDNKLETRRADFYLQNLAEFRAALIFTLGPTVADKVEIFLRENKDRVDKNSRFLCNGDLHPENILYLNGFFIITDWDLLHYNNPGWDLADIYCWGWRDSSWQERLLSEYKKRLPISLSDFEKVFAFDVIYLSSQLIKHATLINAPAEFLEAQKKILLKFLG